MGKYKVLVVGVGNMGSAHAKAYNEIEEFELVGLHGLTIGDLELFSLITKYSHL